MTTIKRIEHPDVDTSQPLVELGSGCSAPSLDGLKLIVVNERISDAFMNVVTVLACLEDWYGVFAYDELSEQIMILRPFPKSRGNPDLFKPRALRDDDVNRVRGWFNGHLKWLKVAKGDVQDAIHLAARENIISPVRHYLEGLPPMPVGEARAFLKQVLNDYFGLRRYGEHPETLIYAETVFRKFLISAVARMMEPACKADHVLILEGPQGAGKSTAVRILFGDVYFGDSIPRLETKDAADYVRGKWGIELSELASFSKVEVEQVKAFITRPEDKFRPAYGRCEITYQRRCVFIGTTNRTDYLRDETGNRRFWPIKIEKADIPAIKRDRDRIWAAVMSLYLAGEQWWPTEEEAQLATAQQLRRTVVDPFHEEVEAWLKSNDKVETCMREVMEKVLCATDTYQRTTMPKHMQHSLRAALNAAGYVSSGKQFTSGVYKSQTIFTRVQKPPS
jgi:predicted P-loop ATPase